ncbi:response regulator [Thalassotalea agariperforans]
MKKILVVEDEVKLAELLKDYLVQADFSPWLIHNGSEVVEQVKQNLPDLILLDLMLPGKDGLTICKEIRAFSNVPIIIITAKVEEIDRLLGLELGADDYICKPFSPREVIARIKTVLRRSQPEQLLASKTHFLLNEATYQLTYNNKTVSLTAIEFNILKVLTKEPGRIFSRSQLIAHIYHDHRVVSERTVDSHIKKLRKKLHNDLPDTELIQSVYSVGYKFVL